MTTETPSQAAPNTNQQGQGQGQNQGMSIDQAMALAHQHWNAGQADQAERLAQQVLAAWPGHSGALHLLGLMAHAFGNIDLAIEHLRKACMSPRTPPVFFSNLAEMCRQRGLLHDAEQAGRSAVAMDPTLIAGWNNLGIILQEQGKFDESLACLERVVALRPDDPEGHNNLANTLKRLGRLEDARKRYDIALKIAPNYAEALSNYAFLLNDLGEPDEALKTVRRAIDANPRLADAYINAAAIEFGRRNYNEASRWTKALLTFSANHVGGLLMQARILKALDQTEEAHALTEKIIVIASDNSEAQALHAEMLQSRERYAEAITFYDRVIAKDDISLEKALVGRGVCQMEIGLKEEALATFDQALARFPRSCSAYYSRGDLKTYAEGDPEIQQMTDLFGDKGIEGRDDIMALNYALAKAWMDLKNSDKAFTYLNEGNRMKRETFDYNADQTSQWVASIASTITREAMDRLKGAGSSSNVPVFIIGMPRSGTTLVEQILASHSDIHGAGELALINKIISQKGNYPALFNSLTPADAKAIGEAYVAEVRKLNSTKAHVVDKMPANFLQAGVISTVLPQARIIHVRRNPVDTCLSCYSKLFVKEQLFTYDLAELGQFYTDYEKIMEHWRAVLPADRFIEVQYEDVVGDLETQARRLIDFIGLPWDEACLSFDKNKRGVRTASVNQVRRPIYKTSVERWKPFANNLTPLLSALGLADKSA